MSRHREICPHCGHAFYPEHYVDGECPRCGERYSWDDIDDDELDLDWSLIIVWESEP